MPARWIWFPAMSGMTLKDVALKFSRGRLQLPHSYGSQEVIKNVKSSGTQSRKIKYKKKKLKNILEIFKYFHEISSRWKTNSVSWRARRKSCEGIIVGLSLKTKVQWAGNFMGLHDQPGNETPDVCRSNHGPPAMFGRSWSRLDWQSLRHTCFISLSSKISKLLSQLSDFWASALKSLFPLLWRKILNISEWYFTLKIKMIFR